MLNGASSRGYSNSLYDALFALLPYIPPSLPSFMLCFSDMADSDSAANMATSEPTAPRTLENPRNPSPDPKRQRASSTPIAGSSRPRAPPPDPGQKEISNEEALIYLQTLQSTLEAEDSTPVDHADTIAGLQEAFNAISATTASNVVFMLGDRNAFTRDSIHLAATTLCQEYFAQLQPPPSLAFPRDPQQFRGSTYWLVTFRFEPDQQDKAAAFAAMRNVQWYPTGSDGSRGGALTLLLTQPKQTALERARASIPNSTILVIKGLLGHLPVDAVKNLLTSSSDPTRPPLFQDILHLSEWENPVNGARNGTLVGVPVPRPEDPKFSRVPASWTIPTPLGTRTITLILGCFH